VVKEDYLEQKNDYSNRELKGAEELDLSKIKNKGTLKEF